jgi:hypothetical protein
MMIKDFFEKRIDRPIETVIKADDREHISDEVAEYVVTHEIARKIKDFFQAYNNYAGVNGVWISGFFGSGKSHLLKILSYVLENKEFDGYQSGELFSEKIEHDEMLKGDVLSATRIPSESVLFNIDQQAQITSKSDANAILSVFYKVFFDHIGYYGFQPHVAEFEMWVDKQGQYADFQSKFESKFGKAWEVARQDYFDPLVTDAIAEVLGELNNTDAAKYETILDDIEDKQKQSIEDFSGRVQDYIKSKPKGFRLNFFVDEVGQYISDNTKLMLNLQTIAESLATRTKGSSWILVTSQEDMEKVVGDMNKSQQNDFSRIQARFKIKVPLTSANVDEVIEKRLLKKKEEPQKNLAISFKDESAHLESLLSFSEAGVQFKGYSNGADFGNKYPFVPYQFDLFQQCRRALSTHNAFQGKHASVGERSMLGVFQQVIQKMKDKDAQALVSFDLMYEGIRNELRGEIQSSVILAEKNLDNKFAIQVLKALFLVKYFGNFKTTKRNITVLLIDRINIDLNEHSKKIEEALNTLENQSYIQRNGDTYEFLTDDEKDVEEDIKEVDVDDQAVTQLLKEIFFDEIIRDNKIKFIDNKQDYEFTSKIDGSILGREKELEVEIITENSSDFENETFLQSQTMGSAGMKLQLASNATFMKDVKMYLRTNKYVKQNQSTSNRSEVKRILQDKAQQNAERKKNVVLMANKSLAESTVYMNGSRHEMGQSAEGKTKVVLAFQDLVKTVYASLRMLGSTLYSEDTIRTTLIKKADDMFKADDSSMTEAESEILNLVNRRKAQSDRTSLNDVKNHFTKKPYGWYPNAIWTITAKLYKRGKIELTQNSNHLDDDDVSDAMLNSSKHGNTLLEAQSVIDPKQINKLKSVYKDAFDESCNFKEGKDVANAFKDKVKEMLVDVNQLLARKNEYPFIESLSDFSDKLERLSHKEYKHFLTNLSDFEDDLLDTKEDLLDPIKRFMNGDQIGIYDSIKRLLDGNTSNWEYIDGDEWDTLKHLMSNPKPFAGDAIKEAKKAKDTLTTIVKERIADEKSMAKEAIEETIADFKSKEEYTLLDAGQQSTIIAPFQEEMNRVEESRYIGNIRDSKSRVADILFTKQLNEMLRLTTPDTSVDGSVVSEPKAHYIKRTNIRAKYSKSELRSEEDVDEYMEALRKAYKEHIKDNRRIQL